jgi:enoyl-CoA hydratase/carnithine racemase
LKDLNFPGQYPFTRGVYPTMYRARLWTFRPETGRATPEETNMQFKRILEKGAIEIALCCDLRIAAENSRFGLPETGLGIIPAAGGTQTLPRAIGRSNALEMLLGNRWLDSREACRVGLVNRVVPGEELLTTADAIASRLASWPPEAVRLAKRAVVEGLEPPLTAGLGLERRLALQIIAKRAGGRPHQGGDIG